MRLDKNYADDDDDDDDVDDGHYDDDDDYDNKLQHRRLLKSVKLEHDLLILNETKFSALFFCKCFPKFRSIAFCQVRV